MNEGSKRIKPKTKSVSFARENTVFPLVKPSKTKDERKVGKKARNAKKKNKKRPKFLDAPAVYLKPNEAVSNKPAKRRMLPELDSGQIKSKKASKKPRAKKPKLKSGRKKTSEKKVRQTKLLIDKAGNLLQPPLIFTDSEGNETVQVPIEKRIIKPLSFAKRKPTRLKNRPAKLIIKTSLNLAEFKPRPRRPRKLPNANK